MLNLVGPFVVNAPFGTEIAFAKGLRRIGHEVIEVDPNVDREMRGLRNDADATVVFKSCVGAEKYLKSLRHPIVVYQPDDARFPHIRQMMLDMRQHTDLFLSFDDFGATAARSMGYRAAETLLLTADDELYHPSPVPIERDIDVSFIGSLGDPVAHASRRRMCEIVSREAKRNGWRCVLTDGIYPGRPGHDGTAADTVEIYQRSKVVLNHATDVGQEFGWGYGIQCRHFEVGMTRTALLSSYSYGSEPTSPLCSLFCDEETLVERLGSLINDKRYDARGQISYDQIMRFHRPEHRAAQLVDFIERNRR